MYRILLLLALPALLNAQTSTPRWYIKAGAGYAGRGFLPQEMTLKAFIPPSSSLDPADGSIEDMTNQVDSTGEKSYVRDTYSKGMNYFLSGGYQLSDRWSVELSLIWLQGADIHSRQVYESNALLGPGAAVSIATHAFGLAINPSVATDIPINDKWYLQARAGLTIPVGGSIIHDLEIDAPQGMLGALQVKAQSETKAGFSMGVFGALGIHRRFGNRFEVFANVNAQHLNLNGSKMSIQQYDLITGGVTTDMLAQYPEAYHNQIRFVDELTSESNNPYSTSQIDQSKPKDELRATSPFTSLGVSIGILYRLGK